MSHASKDQIALRTAANPDPKPGHPANAKRLRTEVACNLCRKKKRRCNGRSPCATCVSEDATCEFASKSHDKVEDSFNILATFFNQSESQLRSVCTKLDELATRLDRIEMGFATRLWASQFYSGYAPRSPDSSKRCGEIRQWPTVTQIISAAEINPDDMMYRYDDRNFTSYDIRKLTTQDGALATPTLSRVTGGASEGNTGRRRKCPHSPMAQGCLLDELTHLEHENMLNLLDAFVQHIYLMHPFLDLRSLHIAFHDFEEQLVLHRENRADCSEHLQGDFARAGSPKRTRIDRIDSPQGNWLSVPTGACAVQSTQTALVLLILALGEICLHDSGSIRQGGKLESGSMSSVVSAPGIGYYYRATQRIALEFDGDQLAPAQIYVLAGLYNGRIGQVTASMDWFEKASRVLQLLLRDNHLDHSRDDVDNLYVDRDHLYRYAHNKRPYQSLVILTTLTCIQLKSAMLADNPGYQAKSLTFRSRLPGAHNIPGAKDCLSMYFPSWGLREEEVAHKLVTFFSNSNWLAKLFAQAQDEYSHYLWKGISESEIRKIVVGHISILTCWRHTLRDNLKWDDDCDMRLPELASKLRAFYYRVMCFVTQPILYYALHHMPDQSAYGHNPGASTTLPPMRANLQDPVMRAIADLPHRHIMFAVNLFIEAIVGSLEDFIVDRCNFVINSIHNTARVQTNHILQLLALKSHPRLAYLLTGRRVDHLLDNTTKILRELGSESQACKRDSEMLAQLQIRDQDNWEKF